MTVKQAAERLEVGPDVIYRLCAAKMLGHRRIGVGRGSIRITEADIAAYLAACSVSPLPSPPERTREGTGLAVRDYIGEMEAEDLRRERLTRSVGKPFRRQV